MSRDELLRWLWVIFIIEGDCRASVPFGWIPLKREWQAGQANFRMIMRAVAKEIRREWKKWLKAREKGDKRDFVDWLAEVGYNANPSEWPTWARNARSVLKWLEGL